MKRFVLATVGAIAFVATFPVLYQTNYGLETATAQNTQTKGQVQLRLDAEKRVVQQVQGKQTLSWEPLQGKALVEPGNILRYTVTADNNSNNNVKNLIINQPIPLGTVYVLNSATSTANNETKITYSIDGGRSFVEKPSVKVTLADGKTETKPAPVTMYTHIRWKFGSSIPTKGSVKGIYQVKVR
ncbi:MULTISPECIES: DUF11 domain-containing protein [Nostocales]|uniref:Conserved repeat protein n=3 Tax=Nostocales TaxID=1161 RepID=A0A0C1R8B6_9CYAN|nr:DUF11 domain-containing protein [Tolypothrix bouteillei]KAF3884152.1 DUF11 domain-containing protein [Tolypothrix bouteillei VB521301]